MLNFPCNKVANNIVACNFVASCMLKCCVQLCCTVYVDCCTQQSCMQHVAWELKIKYRMQHCCMKSVACNMLHATLLYRVCYLVACNFVARKCCMQQSYIVYGGLKIFSVNQDKLLDPMCPSKRSRLYLSIIKSIIIIYIISIFNFLEESIFYDKFKHLVLQNKLCFNSILIISSIVRTFRDILCMVQYSSSIS